ncbi:MAG: hypothetical protein CL677_01085 [Bdellovibrionaceae bacterium]|nr:hypothetical protein [Pseudobdellovibrionaceae bacterium]|tara:strand:- start:74014 stop:74364 length:351 start_codon:yes stop_codon:yes gene_type:complete
MEKAKEYLRTILQKTAELARQDKRVSFGICGGLIVVLLYVFSLSQDDNRRIMYEAKKADFSSGRILGSQEYGFVKDKERSLQKLFAEYKAGQKVVMDRLKRLEEDKSSTRNEISKK